MFVCLSVGYTLLIKPNSIHMLYMGRSRIYRGRFLSKNELNPNNASPFMSKNVTLISYYHVFLIWRRDRGYLKSASDFSFLLCLSNVACKRYPKSANRLSDVWQFNYNERYP